MLLSSLLGFPHSPIAQCSCDALLTESMHTVLGCHGVAQDVQTNGTSELCPEAVFAEGGRRAVSDQLLWFAM